MVKNDSRAVIPSIMINDEEITKSQPCFFFGEVTISWLFHHLFFPLYTCDQIQHEYLLHLGRKGWYCVVLLFLIFWIWSWKYFVATPRVYKCCLVRIKLTFLYEKHLLLISEMSVMSACRPGKLQRNNKHIIMRG